MLRSHQSAIEQFTHDKAMGEMARSRQADIIEATRTQCAELLSVDASDIGFVSSASEGINIVAYGLDWAAGDNIVIADVEFASGIYPWLALQSRGVELRIVKHRNWQISLDDISAHIDNRTRVVLISHVSMFTGQRISLPALSKLVRQSNAALVLDTTHAAGVVTVDASLADVVVTSCYKWLLGIHGTAVFYWNRHRLPQLKPPFLGWNSVSAAGGWQQPTQMSLHPDALRFTPGNPAFLSIYILHNALNTLLKLGIDNIERHALSLTGQLWTGLASLGGWEIMTPFDEPSRAGNICLMTDRVAEVAAALKARDVLVWGTYAGDARLRISCHVYNTPADVDICLQALDDLPAR